MRIATMSTAPLIVHAFPKNRREIVRTCLQEFEGRRVVDLRVWLPRADGSLVQSAKGLTVDQALLPELEQSITAARAALEAGDGHGA
jgi:hypothetical protein